MARFNLGRFAIDFGVCYVNMVNMKRDFTAIYKKSGKWVLAWVEEIPGVNTQGQTLKEAKENLKEAITLILETNRKLSFAKSKDFKRESISVVLPA